MKIIIDTHIFLWALAEPDKLSEDQTRELKGLYNQIYVSAVTVTELMIKSSLGKLNIHFDPVEMTEKMGFEPLSFSGSDALMLKDMPFHHKDPFDRMLIAQALSNEFHMMSNDRKFQHYDCKLI